MQPSLLNRAPTFDGPELTATDQIRLTAHLQRVLDLMRDGRARTLEEIAAAVGCSVPGASARLRDLRKAKFGGWDVHKTRRSQGVWIYWLTK